MLRRGILLYPLVRMVILLVQGFGAAISTGAPEGLRAPSLLEAHVITVPVLIAALGWLDLYRRDEVMFLANLGIGMRPIIALYCVPAVFIEAALLVWQWA